MGDLRLQHNIFLQAFMWKKICDSDEVRLLHQKCHDSVNVPIGDLRIFIEKLNCALNPLNMAIKKGVDELTAKNYYILVNCTDDPISRLSVEYSSMDLEIFKKIVSSIIQSEEGKVSSTVILNFADDVKILNKKISRKDVYEILNKFKNRGWLCEKDGYIFFSTRAIVELQHFFKESFPNSILTCVLCKNIVFQGVCCVNCDQKIHFHCKENYFTQTSNLICLVCKKRFENV